MSDPELERAVNDITSGLWLVSRQARSGDVHVLPLGDLVHHIPDSDCVCGPAEGEEAGSVIWVHHSLDGREKKEQE